MYAFGGRVWWNAVSKTAICGVFGSNLAQAFIPSRFGGLCRGARLQSFVISFWTVFVMRMGFWYFSPPCTTRWPIMVISFMDLIIFCSSSAASACFAAALWFWVCPFSPILWMIPSASDFSEPLKSSYFSDDDPALITRIFMYLFKTDYSKFRSPYCMSSASQVVMAAMLAMSLASHPRERSFMGFFSPCKMGPMAFAPASLSTSLYAMFPANRFGNIRTLARPAIFDCGNLRFATFGTSAASTCISPSISRFGVLSLAIFRASFIFWMSG